MAKFCGGIKLGETLEIVDGIVTLVGETPEEDVVVTPCGQLFNGNDFEVAKHNGKYILTSVGMDEDMDMPQPSKTNCGLYIDNRFWTLNEDGSVDFDPSAIIEVLVHPIEATVTVTYGDSNTPVEPIAGTTNQYKLTELEQTYTVTATLDGYTTQEQDIEDNTLSQIVEITLQPETT